MQDKVRKPCRKWNDVKEIIVKFSDNDMDGDTHECYWRVKKPMNVGINRYTQSEAEVKGKNDNIIYKFSQDKVSIDMDVSLETEIELIVNDARMNFHEYMKEIDMLLDRASNDLSKNNFKLLCRSISSSIIRNYGIDVCGDD